MSMYGSGRQPGGQSPDAPVGYGNVPAPPKVHFEAIGEAWRLLQSQMSTWIVTYLIYLIIAGGASYALRILTRPLGWDYDPQRDGTHIPWATAMSAAFLRSMITSVLAAYFMGGMYRMALKQVRGETISIGELFGASDVFGPMVGVTAITWLATYIGMAFCLVPGLIASGLLSFAPLIVVDQRHGVVKSLRMSRDAAKQDLFNIVLFFFVVGLLAMLGILGCGIGLLVTMPLIPLSMAILYRDFFLGGGLRPGYPDGAVSGPANPWVPQQTGGYTPPPGAYNPQPGNYPPPAPGQYQPPSPPPPPQ